MSPKDRFVPGRAEADDLGGPAGEERAGGSGPGSSGRDSSGNGERPGDATTGPAPSHRNAAGGGQRSAAPRHTAEGTGTAEAGRAEDGTAEDGTAEEGRPGSVGRDPVDAPAAAAGAAAAAAAAGPEPAAAAEPEAAERDDEMDAFFPSVARAAATGEDVGSILDEDLLLTALAEREEYLDSLRRLQADFDNFRKRTERQLVEVRSRASEALLERLLPVLDAYDLAMAHLGEAGEGAAGDAGTALLQVGGLLRETLAKEGLERIDAVDVGFDPTVHDAVAHAEAGAVDGQGGPVVDEVMRAGYLLKGRVMRPAMVKVRG